MNAKNAKNAENKKIYVNTAIPYVNGAPHIGHAVDYILADVYSRYQKKQGHTVRFQVGTDEHGNKISKKATTLDLDTQIYVDQNSQVFRDFIQKLGVEYTDFIRTTDPDHVRRCATIWKKLQPHIYPATYEGWYCEGCERFVTDKECSENQNICPDHNTPYQRISETNYYFRLSDFKDRIRQAIESEEMRILPEFRKHEILNLLFDSPDVSISRPKEHLSWGVPVPEDPSQVMYVWIDALANYITVLGYPDKDISDFWPSSLQIVGKDILRFHAILWPAILLGLDLPLPKVILSHGHVLSEGQKMSKTIGNVIDPIVAIEKHGLPAFRYFFTRHIDTFVDSDFTWDKFDSAYNGELANDLGNLVQRLATLCSKNAVAGLADFQPQSDLGYRQYMDNFEFTKAINYVWTKLQALNRRIDSEKPWAVAKTGTPEQVTILLQSLVKDLLSATDLLIPFLPDTAESIFAIFSATEISSPERPLFPRTV